MKQRITVLAAVVACMLTPMCAGTDSPTGDAWDDTSTEQPDTSGDVPGDILPEGCVPETCNYEDDDCDTIVDNGFDLDSDVENCGACDFACSNANADPVCIDGLCMIGDCHEGWHDINGNPYDGCEYECTPTADLESESDGTCSDILDNDCDGRIDLDDPDCSDCVPEFCNGLDDDCDTLTDEDFDLRTDPLNCGECHNVCPVRAHATPLCVLGECYLECEPGWVNLDGDMSNGCESVCTPSSDPSEFECDGLDDDCDGTVDEDYIPYTCGAGACMADSVCVGGSEVCEPLAPLADEDLLCDGVDNDCDGYVDEEYIPVYCYGVCAPTAVCDSGVEICGPVDESMDVTCDGLDGDCDNDTDEDYVPYSCGLGACERDSDCIGGSESCTPGSPTGPDTDCDGVDEDCDGTYDDEYIPFSCGFGVCVRDSTCTSGSESCTPGAPTGDDTDCDGVDEDCDGTSDEHYVPSYSCGIGACSRGSFCTGGVEGCTPGSPTGPDTDCDGVDDDCDGPADEHYTSYTCGTGVCRRDSVCVSGSESCTPGSPTGPDTDCDGVDEDCDGWYDEHYISWTCGTGACRRSSSCVSGFESCTPGAPSGEVCNSIDDDCDGTPDDGSGTALCGSIAHGTPACVGGTCIIGSCDSGWYDIDGSFSNGCECGRDSYEPSGGSCGSAYNLGTLTDNPGTYINVTGNVVPSGDVDWYRVTVTDDTDTTGDEFEFEAVFTTNPGNALRMDVYRGNCSTLMCTNVWDCVNWYTDYRSGSGSSATGENPCRSTPLPGYNTCSNNGTTFYIRVYRGSGSTTCSSYTIRISNNRPSGRVACVHI